MTSRILLFFFLNVFICARGGALNIYMFKKVELKRGIMVSEDEVYQRMSAELDDVRGSEGFKGANI